MGANGSRPSVAARGMVSCLGLDASTCCAAARAGIDRAELIPGMPSGTATSPYEPVAGHAVPFLGGFEGDARLARLLAGALEDLSRQTEGADLVGDRASLGAFLSLPEATRPWTGEALIADEARRSALVEERAAIEEAADADRPRRIWAAATRGLTGLPARTRFRAAATSGQTGFAGALQMALEDMEQGQVGAAIVAAADSLLDERTLIWLATSSRLKSATAAAGLRPGEAGAAVLLRSEVRAQGPRIAGIRAEIEAEPFLDGGAPAGRGLASAIAKLGPTAGWDRGEPFWLLADQNGEGWRASDWGNAVVRLRAQWPESRDPDLWLPAVSHGETGAASGAIALCTACAAWERGYAPARFAGLLSAGDGGSRAIILLEHGEP
jgi:3-oxoacyl-[acyl-carrier-protein] synthase-1